MDAEHFSSMFVIGVHDGHNSSAALLKDGVIVAAIAEERFSRKKHHYGFPRLALSYLLMNIRFNPKTFWGRNGNQATSPQIFPSQKKLQLYRS